MLTDLPHAVPALQQEMVEEATFAASVGDTLHQIARRVQRESFAPSAATAARESSFGGAAPVPAE